mmetsp:Transcript_32646/g.101685  ORF Transcript_32646/g.101685 Transcript_32646/m.101685 type:complete len:265 (-) Transcript_32646:51-845(-)
MRKCGPSSPGLVAALPAFERAVGTGGGGDVRSLDGVIPARGAPGLLDILAEACLLLPGPRAPSLRGRPLRRGPPRRAAAAAAGRGRRGRRGRRLPGVARGVPPGKADVELRFPPGVPHVCPGRHARPPPDVCSGRRMGCAAGEGRPQIVGRARRERWRRGAAPWCPETQGTLRGAPGLVELLPYRGGQAPGALPLRLLGARHPGLRPRVRLAQADGPRGWLSAAPAGLRLGWPDAAVAGARGPHRPDAVGGGGVRQGPPPKQAG